MARKKAEIEDVKIELTPMIDVVFLLLIFFIVTMKFKVLEGKLETELPKDVGVNAGEVDELLEKIDIKIEPDASREGGFRVMVNDQVQSNMASFRSLLKKFVDLDPEQKATLYPHKTVNYEQVVKVVDQCLAVNLVNITFAGTRFDS